MHGFFLKGPSRNLGDCNLLRHLELEVTPLMVADTGATHGFCVRHLWRFSRGCLLFGKQVLLGFLKCSGKLCSSPAVVVELAFCEF